MRPRLNFALDTAVKSLTLVGTVTLSDVCAQLICHLCDHQSFSLADIDKIRVDDRLAPRKGELIVTALESAVKDGLVARISDDTWVLVRPPWQIMKTVNLSLPQGFIIADRINTFYEANRLEGPRVNPLDITGDDIMTLVGIMEDLLDDQTDGGDPAAHGAN